MAKKLIKKNKNNLLHKTERDILTLINRITVPLSINEIAKKLDLSYMTARKYIYLLHEKKLIRKIETEDG